jgi:hypothetical protein
VWVVKGTSDTTFIKVLIASFVTDIFDGADVHGNVLPYLPIASGDGLGEDAVDVGDGAGEAVHLSVGEELGGGAGGELVDAGGTGV